MGEETRRDRWMTEVQQWASLPANVPVVSTASTSFLEFNDPPPYFGRSSSHMSNWIVEENPVQPIKEDPQQDSLQPLEGFSKVPSSFHKSIEGETCPPYPTLNQSCHPLLCDDSRTKKPSPQKKHLEKPITPHIAPPKVRKEKLGDRITKLQQLVSPFGKTDMASVLLDTIEYIKSLHEQLTVLCAPYVKMSYESNTEMGGKENLGSRGLCLVPISTTCNVKKDSSIDSWAPMSGTSYQ